MSFFDTMILDVIVILFPIFSVLLLKAYYKNTGKLNKDFLIDLANITSLFLLIKYYNPDMTYDELLVNMPLIISILYNRKYASIAIAIILIGFNALIGNNIIITVIEYLFYIIIFVILLKKIKSPNTVILTITCIKGVFMTIEQYYILENQALTTIIKVAIALIVFYLISTIVINIISKIEETISLNQTLKELEKEKNLKNSLFKITHEVKNPIAVCKGYLSMIDYTNKEKAKKYNGIILSEIDRTLDIMDNFSEYTKINIKKDIMDLDSLITDTINSLNPIFKEKSIKVTYKYDDELYIEGDYKRLKQVLINILKNSTEAITTNGQITITLKKLKNNINLVIKDNGVGIPKEDLDKIGDLFYTSKEKGCGIGVALSKEIINQHNGTITYTSKLENYTKVTIKLPLENNLQ